MSNQTTQTSGQDSATDELFKILTTPNQLWKLKSAHDKFLTILDQNPDLNAVQDGLTPLHRVVKKFSQIPDQMALWMGDLLVRGADPNAIDEDGNTPLHKLAGIKEPGDDVNAAATILLQHGARVDSVNRKGEIPLHCATTGEIVKWLVEAGSALEQEDYDGSKPLHRAAERDDLAAVQALLLSGANPLSRNNQGNLPLHDALDKTIQMLTKASGDQGLNARNHAGHTPLSLAVSLGQAKKVTGLLKAGADVHMQYGEDMSLLHLAANRGGVNNLTNEIVLALLDKRMNPNAKNVNGSTPLHYAVYQNNPHAVDSLLIAGANPNVTNIKNVTPLYIAVKNANPQIVQMLMYAGAESSVNTLADDGESPLTWTKKRGYRLISQIMWHPSETTWHPLKSMSDKKTESLANRCADAIANCRTTGDMEQVYTSFIGELREAGGFDGVCNGCLKLLNSLHARAVTSHGEGYDHKKNIVRVAAESQQFNETELNRLIDVVTFVAHGLGDKTNWYMKGSEIGEFSDKSTCDNVENPSNLSATPMSDPADFDTKLHGYRQRSSQNGYEPR